MKDGQRGAVTIMEAAFVFPVMFFVVFMLLMACEAYYQYARVEKVCILAAIDGAARCENPMLEIVQETGKVPVSTSEAKVRPYRYILTSEAKSIAETVEQDLEDTVEGLNVMVFRGMTPTNVKVTATPVMNVLISSFQVSCNFEIKLPIRMIFSDEDITFYYSIQITEPVGDPAEFIRNVSMVQDYLERSKLGESIETYTSDIREGLEKLSRFMN